MSAVRVVAQVSEQRRERLDLAVDVADHVERPVLEPPERAVAGTCLLRGHASGSLQSRAAAAIVDDSDDPARPN